ncbi:aldo/keto reductase [Georgenia sp. Z1344]|uniref:aldo/keto reductase n=1 Tax=Georgenia sp. Z1344 TaxID=3416706 RepID=UPI003CF30BE7
MPESSGAAHRRDLPRFVTSSGIEIPHVALGTWQMDGDVGRTAVAQGIRTGYRLIDTAQRYHNEVDVGRGVRESGVPREELLLVSKLRGGDQEARQVRRSFLTSLRSLDTDYLDLYYIHWPLPMLGRYLESYEVLMELRAEGLIRAIAVSNFLPEHLESIHARFGEYPEVNQVELHPGWPQDEIRAFDAEHGIVTQGWGVAGRGKGIMDDGTLDAIAADHGVSAVEIALAWTVRKGVGAVAKSADEGRQRANLAAPGIELSDKEVERIDAMPAVALGKDPAVNEEY